jgi:proteic killer suppression protein
VIKSFADGDTELLWDTGKRRRVPASIRSAAMKTLRILHRAIQLADLRVPPGNRLKALTGNRKGQFSIRINDQFRVCFVWSEGNAYDVEIVDYH